MKTVLYNMSAPPRSRVVFEKVQIGTYLVFNPLTLANKLDCSIDQLPKEVKKYFKKNPEVLKSIKKPSGYMLAEILSNEKNEYEKRIRRNDIEECEDIELLILIFGCTVGDLFIPERPLSYEKYKFDNILLFPKEDVES